MNNQKGFWTKNREWSPAFVVWVGVILLSVVEVVNAEIDFGSITFFLLTLGPWTLILTPILRLEREVEELRSQLL